MGHVVVIYDTRFVKRAVALLYTTTSCREHMNGEKTISLDDSQFDWSNPTGWSNVPIVYTVNFSTICFA